MLPYERTSTHKLKYANLSQFANFPSKDKESNIKRYGTVSVFKLPYEIRPCSNRLSHELSYMATALPTTSKPFNMREK